MTVSRLLSTFQLHSGNSSIRVTHNSGNHTLQLSSASPTAADTYAWTCDDATTDVIDFRKALYDALDAFYTVTVSVNGINSTDTTYAYHRVKYTVSSGTMHFKLDDALTTIDPRILGFGTEDVSFGSSGVWSDIPRYCWCPQIDANEDFPERARALRAVAETSSGLLSGVTFREMREITLTWWPVGAVFAREAAIDDTGRATAAKLATADENCSLERWVLDLCDDLTRCAYWYPDISVVTATAPGRYGPYRIGGQSPLYEDPLALSSLDRDTGELWRCMLAMRNAVGNLPA